MAIPYLSSRCFDKTIPESEPGYDAFSCRRIVARHDILLDALLRLEKCVKIGKNALVFGSIAQNNAARARTDAAVFEIVTLCIKVTARGFADAEDENSEDETKWQNVTDVFKRILVGALQFLNNLVVTNENRKTALWVELFDSAGQGQSLFSADGLAEVARSLANKAVIHAVSQEEESKTTLSDPAPEPSRSYPLNHAFLLYFVQMSSDIRIQRTAKGLELDLHSIVEELIQRWDNQTDAEKDLWTTAFKSILGQSNVSVTRPTANELIDSMDHETMQRLKQISLDQILKPSNLKVGNGVDSQPILRSEPNTTSGRVELDLGNVLADFGVPVDAAATEEDYVVTYDATYGEDLLRKGKNELIKRLEPESARSPVNLSGQDVLQQSAPVPPQEVQTEDAVKAEDPALPIESAPEAPLEPEEEDDVDSEDDYIVPGDNGRGLLTDVPLILGPGEIEVLPMLIQAGIVCPERRALEYNRTEEEARRIKNLYYVRCHLLLAQENGRNLLRELLIFVAAWDLRDDEIYFRLMGQIMQAILLSGLLPFSYASFREPKDIVSPAQAVIMKLLTHTFRKRQLESTQAHYADKPYPQKVEVHMVRTLLEEFRRIIIPQVCAIVFCQGQIRGGHASADEFPLNLWDMERMYEGVYQYLEFFAILTEHNAWKGMMTNWEITTELVTLIEELDAAIPRSTAKSQNPARSLRSAAAGAPVIDGEPVGWNPMDPKERPYDASINTAPQAQGGNQEPTVPARVPPNSSDNYPSGPTEDEPSAFEWRNLKKLAVLVLSSLVWQNPHAQNQLGSADKQGRPGRGLRALLACCRSDDFNPYVREHAVLAIRFALEGNEGNQKVFGEWCRRSAGTKGMSVPQQGDGSSEQSAAGASQAEDGNGWQEKVFLNGVEIPKEILDLNGYEIFTDEKGERKLRKRARPATAP